MIGLSLPDDDKTFAEDIKAALIYSDPERKKQGLQRIFAEGKGEQKTEPQIKRHLRKIFLIFGDVYKDETLIGNVVRANSPAMISRCYGFGLSASDSEDVTQNVFMEFWKAIVARETGEGVLVENWLLERTKARCINELQKSTREAVDAHVEPEMLESPSNLSSAMLEDALNLLTPRQREMIELLWQGYDNHEIADTLSISRTALSQLVRRARSNLRKFLDDK